MVAPGFAFAQARPPPRPPPAVRRIGTARTAGPVVPGHDAGAPVDLAVALAAQVSAAHADAVAALARLLADPGQHAWLHQAGTPEEPRPLPRAHGRPAAVAPSRPDRDAGLRRAHPGRRRPRTEAGRETGRDPARRETPFPPAGTAGVDPTGGLDSARVDTGDGGPVRGHGRIAAPPVGAGAAPATGGGVTLRRAARKGCLPSAADGR
ncbi:hypothetical protein ACFWDV_06455, partial [Streptomyces diastaticus]